MLLEPKKDNTFWSTDEQHRGVNAIIFPAETHDANNELQIINITVL